MDEQFSRVLALLRERFAADAAPDEVEAFLASEGYDRRQIGEILSLLTADLAARRTGAGQVFRYSMTTFRVMGPHELGRFTPEAWGHLLSLSGAGVLTPSELEHVIERAMTHVDGRIALDDLRAIMETVGFDGDGGADQATVH